MNVKGTEETKDFYDTKGWRKLEEGRTVDGDLFGVKEDGPLRKGMFERKWVRIYEFLEQAKPSEILEVGCGGSPETRLLDAADRYVGLDFSSTGLKVAADILSRYDKQTRLVESDAVGLPFEDNHFDAVYSAHMIYHIADRAAQQASLREMLRVLRPGGRLVLQTANPRPLLFPARMSIRMIADCPPLSGLARKMKGPSPLPYNPAKLSWYRQQLADCAKVDMFNGSIASTHFNQNVSEYDGLGKMMWSFFNTCDTALPKGSAYLGNYVVFTAIK